MIHKFISSVLSVAIGLVFIFSGYSKLYPIEPFEFTFVSLGIVNWELSPFVARLLIGLEFFIGALFILNFNLKKIAYKLGSLTLLVFSIYLSFVLIFYGNNGNCGCFGSMVEMTPTQALIKNAIMLLAIFFLYKTHNGWEGKKLNVALISIFILQSFAFPFILNPVELNYSKTYLNHPDENFELELDTLYVNAKHNVPPKTLSQGKHVIAFMSLTCPHCKIAAKKMGIIQKRNPNISFYYVLNGDDKNIQPFISENESEGIPYCLLPGRNFIFLAGTSFPSIYLINNSIVEHKLTYLNMSENEIRDWLNK